MEREIIFRGKRLDNGEWTCGSLLTYADGSCFICCEIYPGKLNKLQVDPSTVGQYTGLMDKNGKKIFEGDVLKMHYFYDAGSLGGAYEAEETLDVVVTIKQYGVAFETLDHVTSGYLCDYLEDPEAELEILENIWDNPELLEAKE